MKNAALASLTFATVLMISTTTSAQQPKTDAGKLEFETNCAICHGVNAKGGGLYTAHLKVTPSDLTVLAKNNGGVFPIARIYEVIDGRTQVAAHGSHDMPIWGSRYAIGAVEYYRDLPYDQEIYIRNRILTLIDYLYRIQQK